MRALVPLLPEEEQNAVKEPLSQLQMAYARESQVAGRGSQEEESPAPDTQDPTPEDDEREKARSKIWTPPGT